jgi:shikimate kinase
MSIKVFILFGHKGSGKTYFGRRFAERRGVPFIDTDELIKAAESVSQLQTLEESQFRALERQVILDLNVQEGVIALGGGAILDSMICHHLQRLGQLIYLVIDRETLRKRAAVPAFFKGSFDELYDTRTPLYESIKAARIIVSGKTDDEVLNELRICHCDV